MTVPSQAVLTDEQIKSNIVEHLKWDSRVDAAKVTVTVQDREVELAGSVPSYHSRNIAYTDAWAMPGVRAVTNNIRIELPTTARMPSDAEIRENALNLLSANSELDETDIHVGVEDGQVKLVGSVPSHWQKAHAEDLVGNLRGVVGIDNELAVTPQEQIVDKAIAASITAAMDRSMLIDAGRVDVEVNDGVATLTGLVPTWAAESEAVQVANHTPGVIEVKDQLVVHT